eukprot:m.212933 g.212933  ORF g.212933 m.212933 type:complete len:369 (-) comp16952_c0_seq8:2038-3144(-)
MSDAFLCLGFCFSFLSSLDDDIHLRVFLYLVGGGCSMLSSSLFRLAVPEIANISLMSSEAETVRWFLYPQEAAWHNAYPDTSTIMRRSPFIVVSRQDGATTQNMSDDGKATALATVPTPTAEPPTNANDKNNQPTLFPTTSRRRALEDQVLVLAQKLSALQKELDSEQHQQTLQPDQRDFLQQQQQSSTGLKSSSSDNNAPVPSNKSAGGKGKSKRQRPGIRFHCPPKSIMNPMFKALSHFDMIQDGDRILICVSGGKDSLTLLHALKQAQYVFRASGVKFDIGAATVDPGTEAYDPSPLIDYMKALGVPYFYESQCIIDAAAKMEDLNSICSFCSRMKRGRLYACARREGYNVLMFGQHLVSRIYFS